MFLFAKSFGITFNLIVISLLVLEFCPKAYDPLVVTETSGHPRRSVILTIGLEDDVPGKIGGDVIFEFNKDTVKFSPHSSSAQCTSFIEKLPGVRTANCVKETEELPIVFNIEFTAFSLNTIESNVYSHDGNPSLGDFFCENANMMGQSDEDEETKVYCSVADLNTDGLPEYAECSHHGECNARSGQCSCARGFYGAACDDTTDSMDHHVFEHDGPYFTGTVMKTIAYRDRSKEFNVFQAGVAVSAGVEPEPFTTVRGDGTLLHSGGDMMVNQGRVSVTSTNPTKESLVDISFVGSAAGSSAHVWKDSNATLLKGSTFLPGQFHMQLFHTETPINSEEQRFLEAVGTYSVLNITAQGDVSTSGNLCAANRTFVVEDGMVLAESLNVVHSLDVHGSANIEDSLTIGSGFALTPEGMTIDSNTHGGPLLDLRSMQEQFVGSLLEINTVKGSTSSLIRASVDEVVTFDVSTGGDMTVQGLRMQSGGIAVEAGGIQVQSGGMQVEGGFTLLSGDFVLPDNNLKAKSLRAENDNMAQNLLSLTSQTGDYVGTAIAVDVAGEKSERFNILEAKAAGGENIVSIDGAGSVVAAGDSSVGGDLSVSGSSHLMGGVSFGKSSVLAGDQITIPTVNAVYTEISNDGKSSRNEIQFEKGKFNGQVSVITNLDTEVTSGEAIIHPGSTLMFVFNNGKWRALEALAAHFEEITKVKKLEVENDIFIGNHTLTTGGLKLLHLARGDILVGGLDGQVRSRQGFSFSNGVLSTPSLSAGRLSGPLDGAFQVISDAVLENSNLQDASIVAKDIRLPHLSGIAYFDELGNLKSTREFKIDEDGKLYMSDVWNDIDLHSSDLRNVNVISASELKDIKIAEIEKIMFPSAKDSKTGSLAFLSEDSSLNFSSSVSVSSDGELSIQKLGAYEQAGDVNFNSNQLLDATIVGGNAKGLSSVSAEKIQLLAAAEEEEVSASNTLAILTPEGTLQRDDGSEVAVNQLDVASLSVSADLRVAGIASPSVGAGVVDVMGAVTATGAVVKTGVTVQDETLTASSIETAALSVEKMSFQKGGGRGGVLMTDTSGQVTSGTAVDVVSLESETLLVSGAGRVNSLTVTSLKSNSETDTLSLVAVDKDGVLSSPAAMSVEVASISAASSVSAPVFKMPGAAVKGVLTVTDGTGTVEGKSSIEVEDVIATKSVTVDGVLSASSMRLTGLSGTAGYSVLGTDADGVLGRASSIAVEEASIDSVAAKTLTTAALSLPELAAGSMLQVAANGDVQAAASVSVDSVIASSIEVTGDSVLAGVSLSTLQGASVLSTNAVGKIVPATAASLATLTVTESAILESVEASSLSVPKLKPGLMSVGTEGAVTTSLKLEATGVRTSVLEATEKASLRGLELTDAVAGVLTSDAFGVVSSSTDVALDSVTASKTITTTDLNVENVVLGGLQNTLLAVDVNGVVSAATAKHLAHLASETITSEKGYFSALHFTQKDLPAEGEGEGEREGGGKQSDGKSRIMTVDHLGVVGTETSIEMLHVSSDTMAVEMAEMKALLLPEIKDGSLLSIGSQGKVTAAEDITVTSVVAATIEGTAVVADTLKVNSLVSEAGSGLIAVGTDGSLTSVSDVEVSTIASESLSVTGEASLNSLTVGSINFKLAEGNEGNSATATSVLGMDSSSGKVSAVTDLSVQSVKSTSATISGTVSAAEFKLSNSATSGVLSVTEDGSLQVLSEAAMTDLTTKSLSTETLTLKAGEGSGVLVADVAGEVQSSQSVSLTDLEVSNSIKVIGSVTAKELQATSLAGNGDGSALLVADSTGTIQTTADVNVNTLATKSIVVSASASLASLRIKSLVSAPVLTTGADGTVSATNSLTGLQKVRAADVSAGVLVAAQSFSMPTITSAAVLSTDASGRVIARSEITLSGIDVTSLTASEISSSSVRVRGLAAGVVSADSEGKLVANKEITIDDLTAASVTASKSITTASLTLSSAKSASVLVTDSQGAVSASSTLEVSAVSTDSLAVSGLSVAGSLRVGDLSSTKPSLLSADSKGQVVAASDVKVTSVDATDVTLSGSLSTPSMSMPGASVGGVLSVVNSKGVVESSSSVKLSDVSTDQLEVTGSAAVGDLKVKSLATKSSTPELVVVDNTGKMTSIPNLDAYLPDMKDSSFSSVDASGRVSAGSFHVSSGELVDGMVMSVDGKGVVKPSSNPSLSGLTVTSDVKVQGTIDASKFVLADTASSLLYSNARNEVDALGGSQILSDGTLSLTAAKIDSLTGDVALNGHSITGAKIKKALIKESEFFLDASAARHGGNLVVRNLVIYTTILHTFSSFYL
jgi:hypothetical protein